MSGNIPQKLVHHDLVSNIELLKEIDQERELIASQDPRTYYQWIENFSEWRKIFRKLFGRDSVGKVGTGNIRTNPYNNTDSRSQPDSWRCD